MMDEDSCDHWYYVRFEGANLSRAKVDLSCIDQAGLSLDVSHWWSLILLIEEPTRS